MKTPKPIGQRVRSLRKSYGWSAQRLSDSTGGVISRGQIASLESNKCRKADLSLTEAIAIARAFAITLEQLVDYEVTPEALALAAEIVTAKASLVELLTPQRVAE